MGLQAPNAGKTQDYTASPLQVRGSGGGASLNGPVYALEPFVAQAGGAALAVGGAFTKFGSTRLNHLGTWNGTGWAGITVGGKIGVEGFPGFDPSGATIFTLAVELGGVPELICGGVFLTAGGVESMNIATWNGGAVWTALGAGLGPANTLNPFNVGDVFAVIGNNIRAGGRFSGEPLVQQLNRYADWDGAAWSEVDGGFNGTVSAIVIFGGNVVVGGGFGHGGDPRIELKRVAELNGGNWAGTFNGTLRPITGGVNALHEYNGELYAGGKLRDESPWEVSAVLRWDAALGEWQKLNWAFQGWPSGSPEVYAMATYDGDLVAGGAFVVNTNDGYQFNLARWDGLEWHSMGTGQGTGPGAEASGAVLAIAEFDGDLYIGGFFNRVGVGGLASGGIVAPFIAKWNGAEWSAVE